MTGYDSKYTGMIATQSANRNLTCRKDGYCGHEHLPEFNLLNMNARLYDPWTARFLSPDPYVQLPDFTQSFNRYSYCLNNPLKLVDITGELIDDRNLTQLQRAHYMLELGKLRGNKFFDAFYNKIQASSTIFTLKYGDTSKYSSSPLYPIGAFFDDASQTIIPKSQILYAANIPKSHFLFAVDVPKSHFLRSSNVWLGDIPICTTNCKDALELIVQTLADKFDAKLPARSEMIYDTVMSW